jgi:hypothetical protein
VQAVWMVRSRQIARKLVFWLALIGYNPRDHSFSHRLYLIYATIFMSGWGFAMLSLFAGAADNLLMRLGFTPVSQAAAALSTLILTIWALFLLWQVTRRSPFIFSENDAYLICQTPVPGSAVALLWFLGDWFEVAAPFWAGAVTLGFAMAEYQLNHNVSFQDFPLIVAFGLRALVIFGLLQLGVMALLWAIGGTRLQRARTLPWLPPLSLVAILVIGVGLLFAISRLGLAGLTRSFWLVLLWPLIYPAQAAFGAASFPTGLLVALLMASVGLLTLAWVGSGLNLSRAAQETTFREKVETARRYGQTERAREINLRGRLGEGRAPTRLPRRAGLGMLLWKDLLQSSRSLGLEDAWAWLVLFGASMGVCLAPDIGSRGLAVCIWAVLIGPRVTARLQKDLAYWSLLRLLPFSTQHLLLAEMVGPWVAVVLLGWVSLILSGAGLGSWRLAAAILLPGLSAAAAFAAAYDVVRQARSDMLLNGSAPGVSAVGGLLTLVCLALPAGMLYLFGDHGIGSSLIATAIALGLALTLSRLTQSRLQKME